MASYGRNFDFRVIPEPKERLGRYVTPDSGTFVIGQAIAGSGEFDSSGREIVESAAASTPPVKGRHGILVYEHIIYQGVDTNLTTYADISTVGANQAVQLVSGPNVKVVFTNTSDRSFRGQRDYAGRVVVAGLGATPTVGVGDFLEPKTDGDDDSGYWQETATAANAWLVVTKVDTDRGEVEAMLKF